MLMAQFCYVAKKGQSRALASLKDLVKIPSMLQNLLSVVGANWIPLTGPSSDSVPLVWLHLHLLLSAILLC